MAFEDLKLLATNRGDFRKFCGTCEELEKWWGDCNWNVEEAYFSTHFRPFQVDQISRRIIPSKYADLVPIRSTGDGNCLFNSASLAICKNESRAFELRLRTCLELARNSDFYKTHPVLVNSKVSYRSGRQGPGIMSVETLCDITCFDASSSCVYGKKGFDAAFENEIMRTSINYSYSGTLQIMALASVLGVSIQTVYPDQKHKLLPVYENIFEPRQGYNSSNSVFVRILWTNTQGWSDRSKEFTVNHFVPLFKLEDNAVKSQTTSSPSTSKKSKETKSWADVVQMGQPKKQSGRKITQGTKLKREESEGSKLSGENKGTKGNQGTKPDRNNSPKKERKKFKKTHQNEGNGDNNKKESPNTTAARQDKIRTEKKKENVNHKIKMKSCQQKEKTEELINKRKEKKARISENKQSQSENIKESSKNAEQTENEDHEHITEKSEERQACLEEKREECPDNEKQNTKQSEETNVRLEEKTDRLDIKNAEQSEETRARLEEKTDRPDIKNAEQSEETQARTQEKTDRPDAKEQENAEQSEETRARLEEKTDRPDTKEQENAEQSEETKARTQEKTDQPDTKEQENAEQSEETKARTQEKTDQPDTKEQENAEQSEETKARTQEKTDQPDTKEQENAEQSEETKARTQEKTDQPDTKEQENAEQSEETQARTQEKTDQPDTKEQENAEQSEETQARTQEKTDQPDTKEHEDNTAEESEKKEQEKRTQFEIDKQIGQETVKSKRNCQANGKKRRQNKLDLNDSTSDFCSPPKRSIYKPSETAVKFVQDRSALPFPCASRNFYLRQNKKAIHNATRTKRREELPLVRDNTKLIGLRRSKVEGSVEQNLESIEKEIKTCTNKTRLAELWAVFDVAIELQKTILLETSKAAAIYKKKKSSLLNKEESFYFCPIDTYEKLSKHINIAQIYIDQKAFIVEAKDTNIRKVVEIVSDKLANLRKDAVKKTVHSRLKDNFSEVLQYMDSKRDRDVLEAVIVKITSVKSVVSIKGKKFKGSVSKHHATLDSTLRRFMDIKRSCQTVRSDMSVSQQHRKVQREKEKKKREQLKVIASGRGRHLKCEEFPELAQYIEFAFGEGDRVLRGGGGLEADPRLLDTTLFKAADNATVMRHVQEMLKKMKPEFNISTSCLYTYTMNYRKGTKQAERHHHGKGVNADISLHKAPNTSQNIYPINAHWSTSHVNYLVDSASENANGFLLDSKDAKCIVCGDIAPVLKPGKSWLNFETPDHSFDQSRVNAVTPMTHLFMDIPNVDLLIPDTETVVNVTRSGKAVTLINLSLTEPETVFRVFNEIFYLMTIPSLDKFFRNPETGKLKEIMGFVVDNGPSEAPASFLVQMLLVRLLKFLDLDKVTQRSFAEYLSKRNFVERVHAAENNSLSSHGPFCSKMIHENAPPGSQEHKENMESMAGEVIKCISKGVYNKETIKCFRGIGSEEKFIFRDEEGLKLFSLLSDERKNEDETKYRPNNNDMLAYLENVWGVQKNFIGSYSEDYRTLKCVKTVCTDKYSTSIFRQNESWKGGKAQERFDRQPLPDFKRWEESGELHYMSYETRLSFQTGSWDECPGLFLPDKVLDTCFRANPVPSPEILKAVAFLAWVSGEEAAEYFENARKQLREQKVDDLKRETWKLHPLYKESRATLASKCTEANLISSGKKYDLVQRLAEKQGETDGRKLLTDNDLYDGKMSSIPSSTAGLMKLSVAHLRAILRRHSILEVGTKEELIARVGLLKANHPEAAFSRERLCILHYVSVAKEIHRNQVEKSSIRRYRTFALGKKENLTTRNSCLQDMMKNKTPTIEISHSKRTLQSILEPLENEVAQQEENVRARIDELERKTAVKAKSKRVKEQTSKDNDSASIRRSERKRKQPTKIQESADSPNHFTHIGTVLDVLWTEDELEGTSWEPGWYRGEVQKYDEDDDMLYILYFKDRAVFSLNATGAFSDGIIRAVT